MKKHTWLLVIGLLLVLVGTFLPRGWYDSLPRSESDLGWLARSDVAPPEAALPPPPIKGVTLLQIAFVLEGLLFLWLAWKRWTFTRLKADELLPAGELENESNNRRHLALWLLVAITILGLVLRLVGLNSDLWLDEVVTVLLYSPMPVLHVVTSYINSNSHLLNTLLIKLSVGVFGVQAWSVRLPAVLFGAATIPVIYWVARFALSRWASLCAALLLAVSYHHIFFSQNARGYSAYLFFSLISSGLLVKGLQEDQPHIWMLYILTMFLNFAALLNSGFVFASHLIVGGLALYVVRRRGASPLPLMQRLIAVFAVTGFLVFHLYATILPQVYVYSRTVYKEPAVGFNPFSLEFLQELIRGLSAGFGPALLLAIVPILIVAAVGFIVLFRRQWALTLALSLPGVLTAIFLLAQGLTFSPRFFLLGLPFGVIVGVQGIDSTTRFVIQKIGINAEVFAPKTAMALVLLGAIVSLSTLRHYYAVPKQPYRASLEYIAAERKPGEIIVGIHLIEKGYRFYGKAFGFEENRDWFSVRSVAELDRVLSSHRAKENILVTTFPRALRLSYPDLYQRISEGWVQAETFPATIGDGEITVWRQHQH